MADIYDVIIIGGGPAGLTAGIYCSRARFKTLMIEKLVPGGQVMTAFMIENYPGFPEGIQGPDLMERFTRQAKRFGLETDSGTVEKITMEGETKVVHLEDRIVKGRAVIIATGAAPVKLGVPGEGLYTGRGVSYCATCDGAFFRNMEVAVIGGGDSALSEALFLTRLADKVYVIHRRDQLRAEAILQEEAKANPKISFIWDTVVDAVEGDESGMTGLKLRNLKSGETSDLPAQGVFIYVGMRPNTEFLRGLIELATDGYIVADEEGRTSIPGIFAAGDVRKKQLRQIATAVGDGAAVSMTVEKYLK
jgi:thioredoxin reductase (NADPH)